MKQSSSPLTAELQAYAERRGRDHAPEFLADGKPESDAETYISRELAHAPTSLRDAIHAAFLQNLEDAR
jgi:hypothetical protein